MKVEFGEYDDDFTIDLKPETLEEAATLVRFGLNTTKKLRYMCVTAYSSSGITAGVSIGKRKQPDNQVKP